MPDRLGRCIRHLYVIELNAMSGMEIERKFLVKKDAPFREQAFSHSHLRQGYIPAKGITLRIREQDDTGFITIKGPSTDGGLSRYEFEKTISAEEAEQLMRFCELPVIDKTRYRVRHGGHVFEIDEFHADNQGLILAEVELQNADEEFEKPDYIGMEVTGDGRFYNSHLRTNPFSRWRHSLPEEYR